MARRAPQTYDAPHKRLHLQSMRGSPRMGPRKLGTTYNAINVWIFCVIWPLITIGLIVAVVVLWRKVTVLQHP